MTDGSLPPDRSGSRSSRLDPSATQRHAYTLRQATDDDRAFLYELMVATMKPYVVETWAGWDETFQVRRFTEHFDPARCQIVVVDGRDIGMISIDRGDAEIFLANVQIAPDFQGMGLGSAIIGDLLAEAHRRRVPCRLQVLKVNPARRLYERLGFAIEGETDTHFRMRALPQ